MMHERHIPTAIAWILGFVFQGATNAPIAFEQRQTLKNQLFCVSRYLNSHLVNVRRWMDLHLSSEQMKGKKNERHYTFRNSCLDIFYDYLIELHIKQALID